MASSPFIYTIRIYTYVLYSFNTVEMLTTTFSCYTQLSAEQRPNENYLYQRILLKCKTLQTKYLLDEIVDREMFELNSYRKKNGQKNLIEKRKKLWFAWISKMANTRLLYRKPHTGNAYDFTRSRFLYIAKIGSFLSTSLDLKRNPSIIEIKFTFFFITIEINRTNMIFKWNIYLLNFFSLLLRLKLFHFTFFSLSFLLQSARLQIRKWNDRTRCMRCRAHQAPRTAITATQRVDKCNYKCRISNTTNCR